MEDWSGVGKNEKYKEMMNDEVLGAVNGDTNSGFLRHPHPQPLSLNGEGRSPDVSGRFLDLDKKALKAHYSGSEGSATRTKHKIEG